MGYICSLRDRVNQSRFGGGERVPETFQDGAAGAPDDLLTTSTYRPDLDGLRAVAILAVVGFHAAPDLVPGGYVGVDVFFVLSGFLITSLLVREFESTGDVALVPFYRRRAARLAPALLLVLALGLGLYAVFQPSSLPAAGRGAAAAFTYSTDLVVGFTGPLALGPFLFVWSLAIEEQFYLVWPVTLRRLLRGSSRNRVGIGLLILAGLVMVARALAAHDWSTNYFEPQYRADGLMVGAALALLPTLRPSRLALPIAGGLIGCAAFIPSPVHASQIWAHSLATIGAALLVLGADRSPLLATPGLRHLGRISYSLYLWNSLLAGLFLERPHGSVAVPLWLGASLLLAHLSTVYVEEPLRRRWAVASPHRRRAPRSAIVPAPSQ